MSKPKKLREVKSLTDAQLNEDLNATPTWTGNSLRVRPFLEAVANDARHGTYHASCADQFEEMAEAVKNYFEQLVVVEGADMPGLDDLIDALEPEHRVRPGKLEVVS